MFVPSDCIIKSSLNNLEQAVMPHQGIKLQPFHRPLIGHMCSPRVLIGRCFGPVHDSSDEVFMIISSMTKLVKLGKNLKSHLSLSLSDAACDTLSRAGMLWSHAEKHHPYRLQCTNNVTGY